MDEKKGKILGNLLLLGFAVLILFRLGSILQKSLNYNPAKKGNVLVMHQLITQAHAERLAGHLQDALDLTTRALTLSPENIAALSFRGLVEGELGKISEAEADFKKVREAGAESNPDYQVYHDLYLNHIQKEKSSRNSAKEKK